MKPSLTIAVPCHRDLDVRWVYGFRMLEIPFDLLEEYQILMPEGLIVDEARNFIVKKSIGDYIFFLDSDTIPPADTIRRLMAHDKDVVTGLYFQRKPPFYPHIYRKGEIKGVWDSMQFYDLAEPLEGEKKGLIKVDSAGMGCCLIKRSVFDKIGTKDKDHPIPWFKFTTGYGEANRESEDHYFFRRCGEEGIPVYCDTTVTCGHVANDIITDQHWIAMRGDKTNVLHEPR
jgi:hypothetical protein